MRDLCAGGMGRNPEIPIFPAIMPSFNKLPVEMHWLSATGLRILPGGVLICK